MERELKEYAEFEAVPYDHWRVNPEFKRLRISTTPEDLTRLAMLLTGEANMVDVPKVLHQQAIDAGMEVIESPLPTVGLTILPLGQYYVTQVNWNPDTEPWNAPGESGVLVRQAMNRAIDRDQIINELFKGRGEPMHNTIFHPSLEGWNPRWSEEFDEKYGYDPELARQLLDQAGYPGDNGRNRFSLEVWQSSLPGLPETIEVSQTVAQSFEDIGIDVKLVEVEFARAIDAMRDRHDAHFILPVRQTLRPITANTRIYYYAGGGRFSETTGLPTGGAIYMESQLYDDTYDRLLVETDPAERKPAGPGDGRRHLRHLPDHPHRQHPFHSGRRSRGSGRVRLRQHHRRLRPPGVRESSQIMSALFGQTAGGRFSNPPPFG